MGAQALEVVEGQAVGAALEGQEGQGVAAAMSRRRRARELGRAGRDERAAARVQALEAERLRNELIYYNCNRAGCDFNGNYKRAAITQHITNHRYMDEKAREAAEERAAAIQHQQAQAARGRQRGNRRRAPRDRGRMLQ